MSEPKPTASEEVQAPPVEDKRRPYVTPVLKSLGTVKQLTHGTGGSGPDAGGQVFP